MADDKNAKNPPPSDAAAAAANRVRGEQAKPAAETPVVKIKVAPPQMPPEVPAAYDPEDWTKIPGVVGELTEHSVSRALYPSRSMATGTALATIAALMGRYVETPSGNGTQLYINNIAPTGTGKDRVRKDGPAWLMAAGAEGLVGPSEIFSSSGLIEEIKKRESNAVFCAFWDEFGPAIERSMCGDAWGRDLLIVLQKLFTCWQENFLTPAAARKPSESIWSPFVVVCGFTPPAVFFKVCSMGLSAGGFLNRLLNFEQIEKPPMCHENLEKPREVPDELAERLRAAYLSAQTLDAKLSAAWKGGPLVKMKWGDGAKQLCIDLAAKMNAEPDEQRRELFARVAEITERVASVISFGRFSRVVEVFDVLLARDIVLQSAEILYAGVLEYAEEELSLNSLCKKIVEWLRAAGGSMTQRDVMRKARPLIKRGGEVGAAIEYLKGSEIIEVRSDYTGGRRSPLLVLL
jgi:hypothetical protein